METTISVFSAQFSRNPYRIIYLYEGIVDNTLSGKNDRHNISPYFPPKMFFNRLSL